MILKCISWVLALSTAFQPAMAAKLAGDAAELQPPIPQALRQVAKAHTYGELLAELMRQTPAEDHAFFAGKLKELSARKIDFKMIQDSRDPKTIFISDDQGHQTTFKWLDAAQGTFTVNNVEIQGAGKSGHEIWQAIEAALPRFSSQNSPLDFLVPSAHAEMTLIMVGLAAVGTLYYFLIHKPVKKAWMKRRIRKCEEMKKNPALVEPPKTAQEQKELDGLLKQLSEFETEHEKKAGKWAADKKLNALAGDLLKCLQDVRGTYLRAHPSAVPPNPGSGGAEPAHH